MADKLYILDDDVYTVSCCGLISHWEFYPIRSGTVDFLVWRPNGTSYNLVGYNTVSVRG